LVVRAQRAGVDDGPPHLRGGVSGLIGLVAAFAALLGYVRDHVGEVRIRLTGPVASATHVRSAAASGHILGAATRRADRPVGEAGVRGKASDAPAQSCVMGQRTNDLAAATTVRSGDARKSRRCPRQEARG
jgi:hypothetical protein